MAFNLTELTNPWIRSVQVESAVVGGEPVVWRGLYNAKVLWYDPSESSLSVSCTTAVIVFPLVPPLSPVVAQLLIISPEDPPPY